MGSAGPDVSSLKVGDEVAAVLWNGGAFAEECVCAASQAIRLPSELLLLLCQYGLRLSTRSTKS